MLDRADVTSTAGFVDAAPERLIDQIAALAREVAAADGITGPLDADAGLVDAGLTSVGMVNLMIAVEAAFDLTVPRRDMSPQNFRSIRSIADLVQRLTSP